MPSQPLENKDFFFFPLGWKNRSSQLSWALSSTPSTKSCDLCLSTITGTKAHTAQMNNDLFIAKFYEKRRHSFGSSLIHLGKDTPTQETRGLVLLGFRCPGLHLAPSAFACSGSQGKAGGSLTWGQEEAEKSCSKTLLSCSKIKDPGMLAWSIHILVLVSRGKSVSLWRKQSQHKSRYLCTHGQTHRTWRLSSSSQRTKHFSGSALIWPLGQLFLSLICFSGVKDNACLF